jgi:hypothetical protein
MTHVSILQELFAEPVPDCNRWTSKECRKQWGLGAGVSGSQRYGLADGLSAQRLLWILSWGKPFLRSNPAPIGRQTASGET